MPAKPVKATILSYQVGFGDCFLLRFTYDNGARRHLLIDFGTTSLPDGVPRTRMTDVARHIAQECSAQAGDRLDVVVASHRHADHISGFATTAAGDGPGDIIRALDPRVVVQPWTEDPDAPTDSLGPALAVGEGRVRNRLAALDAMHESAEKIVEMLAAGRLNHLPERIRDRLGFIGEDNVKNLSAVRNLVSMGRKRVYAYHGCDAGLARTLPGVRTHVLGPPTLAQTETIRKQRSSDPDQFWQLVPKRLAAIAEGKAGDAPSLFPDFPFRRASKLLTEQRWLAERIDEANGEELLGIVLALDKQMNNTSLILLFQAGSKTLLFPGDAQIENWEYALQSPFAPLLDTVDLYKVGHHGSRNATPMDMWNRFAKRGGAQKPDRMTSVMSTLPGKHGHLDRKTEVPRESLVDALSRDTDFHSTHLLPADRLFETVELDLA